MAKLIITRSIILIIVLLITLFLISIAYADENNNSLVQINNKTFKVLIDDKKEQVFDYKTPLKLVEGYELHVTSVDSDGAHLLLTKGWDKIDTKVISPWKEGATIFDKTYYYNKSFENTTNVTVIEVRLKSAVISKEDYSVTVDRIRQISDGPILSLAEIQSIKEKEKEERDRPKKHSYLAGTPDVDEFVLNWTDKKTYSEITSDLTDITGWELLEPQTSPLTHYQIYAKDGTNTTLSFAINWHPGAKRPVEATLTNYPSKLHTEMITSQSDITIQGRGAIVFAYREQKDYRGINEPPMITPPFYLAKYFLDDHTEVFVNGDQAYWSIQDFKDVLNSLRITPPKGYY